MNVETVIPLPGGTDIIIPFRRNAHFVERLLESLQKVREELRELNCAIVVINDAPGDPELMECITKAVEALSATVTCRQVLNKHELGFVRSVNSAARQAVALKRDVILLTSDALV